MPVYDEAKTIRTARGRLLKRPEVRELIVVDDCPIDGTGQILAGVAKNLPARWLFSHKIKQGNHAAIRTVFARSMSPLMIMHDADCKYDPTDCPKMLALILKDKAEVVYKSRVLSGEAGRVLYFWPCAVECFPSCIQFRDSVGGQSCRPIRGLSAVAWRPARLEYNKLRSKKSAEAELVAEVFLSL